MKVFFLILFFYCFALSQGQSLFIDYEKDSLWIKKLENMSGAEKNKNILLSSKNIQETLNISMLKIDYNPILEKHINKYLSYKWLPKTLGLFEYYKPLFENKLKEYNLPIELALLPIVESNLNPQAVSPAGAQGLWQFMPNTGKQYGLVKNNNINLFYDPYISTDSACKFLSYLYRELQDWNLVLSAYNSGLGRVKQAIKKAGTTNYWEVRKYLPQETQAYVPSFYALKYIHYNYYSFYKTIPVLKYSFDHVKEITILQPTTFKELAFQLKINLSTFYFLNPHITSEAIPKNSFVYYLIN